MRERKQHQDRLGIGAPAHQHFCEVCDANGTSGEGSDYYLFSTGLSHPYCQVKAGDVYYCPLQDGILLRVDCYESFRPPPLLVPIAVAEKANKNYVVYQGYLEVIRRGIRSPGP